MLIKQNQLVINGTTLEQSDLQAIANVASDVQAQIDTKAPINNAQFTGNVGIGTSSPSAYGAGYTTVGVNGSTMSGVEGFVNGTLTSYTQTYAVQTLVGTKTATPLIFVTDDTQRMRIDSSGNVGIGVVPEAWSSLYGTKALQVGAQASLSDINGDLHLSSNAYYDATNARWEYINADYATKYTQVDGLHQWLTAASGTADAAITWSESMRIDSSGNVGIGTTSPAVKLHVYDSTQSRVALESSSRRFDIMADGDGLTIRDQSAAVNRFRINTSGNLVLGNAGVSFTSDRLQVESSEGEPAASFYRPRNTGGGGLVRFMSDVGGTQTIVAQVTSEGNFITNGGINFGGAVNSGGVTSSSNTLDDYEEGTWTPNFTGLTNTPGYHNLNGKYTKIGNIVHLQFFVQLSHNPVPTFTSQYDRIEVTGVPFPCDNGTGYQNSQGVVAAQSFLWDTYTYGSYPTTGQIGCSVDASSKMGFEVSGHNQIRSQVRNKSFIDSAAIIEASITYKTNS